MLWDILKLLNGMLALIGIAGIPDNLQVWAKWLTYIDNPLGRLSILAFAIAMFAVLHRQNTKPESTDNNRLFEIVEQKPVSFGYPLQMAKEPHLSWWHVPIALNPAVARIVDHCRVTVAIDNETRRMRWQSDSPEGSHQVALRIGEDPQLVPIAYRSEINMPSCPAGTSRLTDEAQLLHRKDVFTFVPTGQKHNFTLRVQSEDKQWDQRYELFVPEVGHSNGHFILRPADS